MRTTSFSSFLGSGLIAKAGGAWRVQNRAPLLRAGWQALAARGTRSLSLRHSLAAAYGWLCAAQDATPDGGVAGWYSLVRGWSPSYPETTGYIIPTFLTYARVMQRPDARERAIRMADWEVDVQLPSGAVRSGVLGTKVGPAVFNTGQVLFGWVAAYQATGDERYAAAAQRAAEWLCRSQDADGAWRKDLSLLTRSSVQTYNVRAAWGLALAGQVMDEPRWIEAAVKNCDWALRQQQPNGWFRNNGFTDDEAPLLHTIGYTLEGLEGAGALLSDERYVDAARRGASQLIDIYRRSGVLRGRYEGSWRGTVSWRCLTGEAQVALVLRRLAKQEGVFLPTAQALLGGLATIQDTESPYPESRGGLAGSAPLWGGYCPLAYVNWAAKFYVDVLLLHLFGADVQSPPMASGRSAPR
jgi:hypothetical protein